MKRPTILTCCDYYLPGYKAGGPIVTLSNLTASLSAEFDFKIITRDRDLKERTPYTGISSDVWTTREGVDVFYVSGGNGASRRLARAIRDVDHDLLYLNSLFSPRFSAFPLLLRRLGWIPKRPVVVAPRGECAAGAFALKSTRKRGYLAASQLLSLHQDVLWQAVCPHERDDIVRQMGPQAQVAMAANLARVADRSTTVAPCRKQAGQLKLLCLGRVSAVKNTAGALRMLNHAFRGAVQFDIAGPPDDDAYWQACHALARQLPDNVSARFLGPVPASDIPALLAGYHVLFSPTTGENFGHAIVEGLAAGCPALISDRTPWRNLAAGQAGWDLPLDECGQFQSAIQEALEMDQEHFAAWRAGARAFARSHASREQVIEQNRQLFHRALESPTTRRLAA